MGRPLALLLLATTTVALSPPTSAAAQTEIRARAATLTVGGRLHGQYQASSVDGADNDFFIRRARIKVDMAFNDFFSGKVLTDFSGGGATLLDAYVSMNFSEQFRVSAGQTKRAFDIFELVSSTDLSLIERDGRVGGYSMCTGVGSVCSYSRLTEELDFAGRDTGVRVDGSSGAISYQGTLTNGRGVGIRDENDGKSVSGRASFAADGGVVVSANVGMRDYLNPLDETASAVAWGADVQLGTWRDGFLLQAALAGGDNWQSLDGFNQPGQFFAVQAAASFYHPLVGDRFVAVEPLARLSVADPDGDTADDGGTLFTPGVMLYMMGRNKLGVNLDYYMPQTGDAVYSVKFQTFLYF